MSTFTVANDQTLVAAIDRCRTRLAYIAPGVTKPIADAIGRLYARPTPPQVSVILDADPEVYRLGFGTEEGITRLRELVDRYQFALRSQPGLRVGVLVSDDDLLVYAPTPLLIEAGDKSARKPNAINLGAASVGQVLDAAGAEGAPASSLAADAEIGRGALSATDMDDTVQDLRRNPPKAFDIARVERVFSSALQYVELEITGYKLSTRRVSIPNDLLIGEDRELDKRLKNTYALLQQKVEVEIDQIDPETGEPRKDDDGHVFKEPYSEKILEGDRKRLEENYLTNIVGHGWLIKRADRPEFDQEIKALESKLDHYWQCLEETLQDRVKGYIHELACRLLFQRDSKLPARLRKRLLNAQPTKEEKLAAVVDELAAAFGKVHQSINPKVRVQYKDLTYETIKDDKFRKAVAKAYQSTGKDSVLARLFDEYDAAREADRP